MCGILGIVNTRLSGDAVNSIINTIAHRGPDDRGIFTANNITLAHLRLSIQDLSANGHQPMLSADGNYVIVFNGEIYNHWGIRADLQTKGFSFRSSSDTETLLYAYIAYGTACLDKLNGIFSFAIYDKVKNELFIARDNFGVKPLYYYDDGSNFMFASELKAMLNIKNFDYTLDSSVFYNYLLFLWSPGQETPFRNIKKLLPGHYMTIKPGHSQASQPIQYYKVPFTGHYSTLSESALIDELDEQLQNAVKRQMLSDVPVGFFLSGGLDSSLIAAIAKKMNPAASLKAYTIDTGNILSVEGFTEDLPYAKKVVRHLDLDLEIIQSEIDIHRDFDKMIWHLDEPIGDATPLNVLNISSRARAQGYKVLLGGTAADDVFSGYRRHRALNMEKYISLMPRIMRKGLEKSAEMLPLNTRTRRVKKLFKGLNDDDLQRRINYFLWLSPAHALSLFNEQTRSSIDPVKPYHYFSSLLQQIPQEHNKLNQMLFWEMNTFLPDYNLNYTDKMAMATGVEVRVPFLDKELVNFSTQIPPALKLRGKETKYILKKLAQRYLPNDVIYRPKTGFLAPIRKWVKDDLKDVIKKRLLSGSFDKYDIFDQNEIEKLIDANAKGRQDNAYPIWTLLSIESWLRQFTS